jgi:hypothetical protein
MMTADPRGFRAPFITRERAWQEADRVRREHWPSGAVPVDVERLLTSLGLRLEPIHGLKEQGDIDALLLGDLRTIIVDAEDYMDDRMENRIRFSIAHEIGHFILHAEIYRGLEFHSIDEWVAFIECLPEDQWDFIEQQAYEFAGRLLVPIERLSAEVDAALRIADLKGFQDWDASGDAAKEYLATRLCRIFGTSSQVVERRLRRENLPPERRR